MKIPNTEPAPVIRCSQCNKPIKHLPFAINNIICRDCYGLERYRRQEMVPSGGGGAEALAQVVPPALPSEKTDDKKSSN